MNPVDKVKVEGIEENLRICKHCGQEMLRSIPSKDAPSRDQIKRKWACNRCGSGVFELKDGHPLVKALRGDVR